MTVAEAGGADIAGYRPMATLADTTRSYVVRAQRPSDGAAVVLKLLNEPDPAESRRGRIEREYRIAAQLPETGIVRPLALERDRGRPVLVMPDDGAESLDRLLAQGPVSVAEALAIARSLAETLAELHAHKVVHKDINPSNILYRRDDGRVRVIDFGLAALMGQEEVQAGHAGDLEGTLAYMAPEQTGRINRGVDYRADFYGLGASLFALLTGQPPFGADDPLSLVHAHLAIEPPAPSSLNSAVPAAVDALVARLLAKTPEARYQSGQALLADLAACAAGVAGTRELAGFTPGRGDIPLVLTIPEKLYGRADQLAELEAGFEEAAQGASALTLVTGEAGIGKSALVNELYRPVTARGALFVGGKFDQRQADRPYSALIAAADQVMAQLLSEPAERLAEWQARLEQALGENAGVVAQVVPRLTAVIGEPPPLATLDPQGEKNRFRFTMTAFLRALVAADQPLVLFIDDLQWADTASLELLAALLTDRDLGYIYVVGAYRWEAVDADHPVSALVERLREAERGIRTVHLGPLEAADVAQLLSETFYTPLAAEDSFTQQAYAKTLGNPFFLNQLMRRWDEAGAVWADPAAGRWRWDEVAVARAEAADNVVAATQEKLATLPAATQDVLSKAAVLGSEVELADLTALANRSGRELLADLTPGLEAGLVRPVSQPGRAATPDGGDYARLRFLHDRIQEAALARLDSAQAARLHVTAGRQLRRAIADPERTDRLFDLVGHLNAGRHELADPDERRDVAWLNRLAAGRAQSAAAYGPALDYVEAGLAFLGEDAWHADYAVALALYDLGAQSAFFAAQLERSAAFADTVLAQARVASDTIIAREMRVQGWLARGKLADAVNEGLASLAVFGERLPARPGKLDVVREQRRTERILGVRSIEQQLEQPAMADPDAIAAIRMASLIFTPLYMISSGNFVLVGMRLAQLTWRHGNHPTAVYGLAGYATVASLVGGDPGAAGRIKALVDGLLARFDAEAYRCAGYMLLNYFVEPWRSDPATIAERLSRAFDAGVRMGAWQFAGYTVMAYGNALRLAGATMAELAEGLDPRLRMLTKMGNQVGWEMAACNRQIAYNLGEPLDQPHEFRGPFVDEDAYRARQEAKGINANLSILAQAKLEIAVQFGQATGLQTWIDLQRRAGGNRSRTPAIFRGAMYALIAEAWLAGTDGLPGPRVRRRLMKRFKALAAWNDRVPQPENFAALVDLTRAELARLEGGLERPLLAYNQACRTAAKMGQRDLAGLARERAHTLLAAHGAESLARDYLRGAWADFEAIGASGKLAFMRRYYGSALPVAAAPAGAGGASMTRSATFTQTTEGGSQAEAELDLEAVVRASQTIAQEIQPERVIANLMRTVGQTAGATNGYLLLGAQARDVRAQARLDTAAESDVTVLADEPVTGTAQPEAGVGAPLTVLRYALRQGETVALDRPADQGSFRHDPYLQAVQPASVLVLPLANQGRNVGALYLEHRHTPEAFPENRVNVLSLLSAQMAIAIENARLYGNMEAQVAQRTRELEAEKAETERAHRVIRDSLETARRMQEGALPALDPAALGVRDVAAWWQPRDQVGGDFYRLRRSEDGRYVAAVLMDCTGHGVPGALISFIASAAADRALRSCAWEPVALLRELDGQVRAQLHGGGEAGWADDGLEAGVLVLDTQTGTGQYAGVGIHLFIAGADGVAVQRATDGGLGYRDLAAPAQIPCYELAPEPGAMLVLPTDGLLEQTGGAKGLQLGRRGFARLLENSAGPDGLDDRLGRLRESFAAWQGDAPQRDDVTVLALRLPPV